MKRQVLSYLKRLPGEITSAVRECGSLSKELGMRAYLVGGFVRDLILGVDNFDVDITVEGDGMVFCEALASRLGKKFLRHRRFSTATCLVNPHLKIDIASSRKESYPHPASLPVVEAGSLKDDLLRRDFTINAMALGISPEAFGKLIDPFSGINDLRMGIVRIMHKDSFIDDPTRILRAIRFEQRYGFSFDPVTLASLKRAVGERMLERLEPQRLRDELVLILKEKDPVKTVRRLGELCGMGFLSRRVRLGQKQYRLLNDIKKQIEWFNNTFPKHRKTDDWLIYMMGLVSLLPEDEIRDISRKFALRRGEEKRLLTFRKDAARISRLLRSSSVKPNRVHSLLEPLSYETMLFARASSRSSRLKAYMFDFLKLYNGVKLSVRGEDLRKLGLKPGPRYQKILNKILRGKIDGVIKTRKEELAWAKRLSGIK